MRCHEGESEVQGVGVGGEEGQGGRCTVFCYTWSLFPPCSYTDRKGLCNYQ